jgi:glycosyltransferase involved in cell wall biosynthesis
LLAVEVAASSVEYAWTNSERLGTNQDLARESENESQTTRREDPRERQLTSRAALLPKTDAWTTVTLQEVGTRQQISTKKLAQRLDAELKTFDPQAVLVPGWSSRAAFLAIAWCLRNRVPIVLMSESTAWDEKRRIWREAVKHQVVRLGSAALVGGQAHARYMAQLGMPADLLSLGYDMVDNVHFAEGAAKARSETSAPCLDLPSSPFFLASARFIEKKNLSRLIEAYARYRTLSEARNNKGGNLPSNRSPHKLPSSDPWRLVLLGDGQLRSELCRLISDLGLQEFVNFPGFKQYPELPAYYGLASVFIHASTTEQWGLVVNEAMASGLPVLVSDRCGCAMDLVKDGVNGFTFDPYNVEQLAELMLRVSAPGFPLAKYGLESQRIIADWGPDRFAAGLKAAAEKAIEVGPIKPSLIQRLILKAMIHRL